MIAHCWPAQHSESGQAAIQQPGKALNGSSYNRIHTSDLARRLVSTVWGIPSIGQMSPQSPVRWLRDPLPRCIENTALYHTVALPLRENGALVISHRPLGILGVFLQIRLIGCFGDGIVRYRPPCRSMIEGAF
jgi:hypothetical protein